MIAKFKLKGGAESKREEIANSAANEAVSLSEKFFLETVAAKVETREKELKIIL